MPTFDNYHFAQKTPGALPCLTVGMKKTPFSKVGIKKQTKFRSGR
jgi:hypothetical protein